MSEEWSGHRVKKARAYWRTRLQVEALPCSRCGQPVLLTERWDVDHLVERINDGDLDNRDNQWPAHRSCNRRAGQRISTARKASARATNASTRRVFDTEPTTLAPAPPVSLSGFDPSDAAPARPLYSSASLPFVDLEPLHVGARMLGFTPKDHQVEVASILLSGEFSRYAVEIPRRSGKTLTIAAVLLGLCATRPGFVVRFSAQNGVKTQARFESLADMMGESDAWVIRRAAGSQAIRFDNTSRFYAHPPKGDAWRGEDTDAAWLDEAQEHDLELSRELLSAIGPTQDTRPGSILVVSGTTGEVREGILWDTLQRLRAGTAGGVEYAVPDGSDVDDEAVWWAAHPGLSSGLTTLEKVRERRLDMDAEAFGREYLGIWPVASSSALIDQEVWASLAVESATPPADGSAVVAFDCDPGGASAAVWLAWKDHESDTVVVKVVDVADGTLWVAQAVHDQVRALRARAVYDPIGPNIDVAAQLTRLRTPRVEALRGSDLKGGYSSLLERVSTGRLQHVPDDDLDQAVAEAARRPYGESWLWKRTPSSHALVAVTHAAWVASNTKKRERTRIRTGAA